LTAVYELSFKDVAFGDELLVNVYRHLFTILIKTPLQIILTLF